MYLNRLEVEEGFLDGLAMDFVPGLNVIIGPRGTGKTSIIELIRFCLDVQAFTTEAHETAMKHAADVLGSGRVVINATVDGGEVSIARSLTDEQPRMSRTVGLTSVSILSQKEIEQVGKDGAGQLRLIDEFAPQSSAAKLDERQTIERIRSLTTELHRLTSDRSALRETVAELTAAKSELSEAQAEARSLTQSIEEREDEQAELDQLGETSSKLASRQAVLERALDDLRKWDQRLRTTTVGIPTLPSWPESDGETDRLQEARSAIEEVRDLLRKAQERSSESVTDVESAEAENRQRQADVADRSRELRRILDAAAKGAGAASARVASLQEKLGAMEPTQKRLEELNERIQEVQKTRQEALDELDALRKSKYERRAETAGALNRLLGPRIDVDIERYGRQEAYSAAIAETLRGTRLHYNQLAPILAAMISPRELVEAAETGDVESVADIAGLDSDRVTKVLDAIQADGGAEILGAQIEDAAHLRLLDGDDYKPSNKLSTGQRCTIVLPILLEQRQRSLVIDQPEDHLDNGFIVDTVVKAIRSRPGEDQLIVATHNANIPVLGEASRVFVLASDGSRGFIDRFGPLNSAEIIEAITRIMEGGLEAFERRREFYQEHGV